MKPSVNWLRLSLTLLGASLLNPASPAAASAAAGSLQAYWVVLGPNGEAVARAITFADRCPVISIDGQARPMRQRSAPGVETLRPTRSAPALSKPSSFPVLTCEADIPASAKRASVEGKPLALPRAQPKRIVVIGDTGCRLKAADNAWQACNDPAAYPLARIAAQAAAWKPDLVIHVGDYLYRENPCPEGNSGCAGSPWGYGWDAWQADFFAPGAPLLEAAPWVMVRGNHENCNRAGQGWWRFIDPRRLEPGRDCNDPKNDALGDYQGAYTVPIGSDAQLVAMDIATSGEKDLDPQDPRFGQLGAIWNALAAAGRSGKFTMIAGHYPVLGLASHGKAGTAHIEGESAGVQSAFRQQGGTIFPPGIDLVLSGHVHLWEQASFVGGYPSQFIAGFSGTQEDVGTLPDVLPEGTEPAEGVRVASFASWTRGFGWMSMERRGARQWDVIVHSVSGEVVGRCRIDGRQSSCR